MTIVTAAAVQISPVLYSREGIVDTFPETVVPYARHRLPMSMSGARILRG